MNKPLLTIITALCTFALISSFTNNPTQSTHIRVANQTCTQDLAVECAVDIERTVRACAAAFETEGTDIIADIKCAKDLLSDKKHCWPCICYEADKRGWKVIGCK